jgi:hypothetical protein
VNKIFLTNCFEAKILLDLIVSNRLFVVTTSMDALAFLLNNYRAEKIQYIDLKSEVCPISEIVTIADSLARVIDLQTGTIIGSLRGSRVATNWEYWDKFYFICSNIALSRTMQNVSAQFKGSDILLPFPRSSQDYYYKGRIGAEIIESNLIRCGAIVHRLETGHLPPILPAAWTGSFTIHDMSRTPERIQLVHLPTCWYDRNELQQLYSGDQIFDIDSPYHNVIVNDVNRISIDPNETIQIPEIHLKQIEAQYSGLLRFFDASAAALEDQVSRWIDRHKFQLRALMFFEDLRQKKDASLLALAEHDGGLSGPLAYAFRSQESAVNYHHHSKFVVGPIPNFFPARLSKYFDPILELKDLGDRCAARAPNLHRANRHNRIPKRVAILFTDWDFPGGSPIESLACLKSYLHQIISNLREDGLEVTLRPRPGTSINAMLEIDCPVWNGDLVSLAEASDVVIGIGSISSAMIEFWTAGCICIQVQTSSLNPHNMASMPKDSFSIVSGKSALKDPNHLLNCLSQIISSGDSVTLNV